MAELAHIEKERYQRNLAEIDKLRKENDKLEQHFMGNLSQTLESSWDILRDFLNRQLVVGAYIHSPRALTLADCKLRMTITLVHGEEIVKWELILPRQEKSILPYWPKKNITNKHYLLSDTTYQLDFIKFLEERKFIEVERVFND